MTPTKKLVKVKNEFQVVIPKSMRDQLCIHVGDQLEARIVNGKLCFTPKSSIDQSVTDGLEDLKNGRCHGPYGSAESAIVAISKPLLPSW